MMTKGKKDENITAGFHFLPFFFFVNQIFGDVKT